MTRILVTGTAGFIGSHLSTELLKRGFQVVGVDNFNDYYSKDRKLENISSLVKNNNFHFIEGDLRDKKIAESVTQNVELIYHLAGMGGVRNSIKNPALYMENNIISTANLLELSNCKFVFASSSSVYGNVPENQLPVSENVQLKPVSPYALSKKLCEEICELYAREFGRKIAVVRYFTVYGPRQRPDEAFTKFINLALAGQEIPLYGDGSQTRDFTFVSDAVNGTILAAEKGNGIYNISGGKRHTMLQVLENFKE